MNREDGLFRQLAEGEAPAALEAGPYMVGGTHEIEATVHEVAKCGVVLSLPIEDEDGAPLPHDEQPEAEHPGEA